MFSQVFQITAMNLRSIPQRLGSSLVICVGIGGVVAVLVTVLSMAHGLTGTLTSAARADRALIIRSNSRAEVLSSLTRDEQNIIENAVGVRHAPAGPLVSPEVLLAANLPTANGGLAAATLRGITAGAFAVRPELQLQDGRWFGSGLREVVVGRAAAVEFANMNIGDSVSMYSTEWTIVGVFTSNRDVHESELLADANAVMTAGGRTVFSAITFVLDGAEGLQQLQDAVKDDPRVKVDVMSETEYYRNQSEAASTLLSIVANAVAGIMALGATFGALNAMYSSVSERVVEIGTLRALGFGATPVVLSVLTESLLLAIAGALAGAGVAWLLFNGDAFSTGGGLGQISLQLHIGTNLLVIGIVWGCVMGLIGGLFPAVKAARMPVVVALRAT